MYSRELIGVERRALLRESNPRVFPLSVVSARRFSRNLVSTNHLGTVLLSTKCREGDVTENDRTTEYERTLHLLAATRPNYGPRERRTDGAPGRQKPLAAAAVAFLIAVQAVVVSLYREQPAADQAFLNTAVVPLAKGGREGGRGQRKIVCDQRRPAEDSLR